MSISVEATGKYYILTICVPYAASKLQCTIGGDTFEM